MASKHFLVSSLLLLLLLLSDGAIANASFFRTIKDLKSHHRCHKGIINSHEEASVGARAATSSHAVNNIPTFFQALPRRTRIPTSGPSQRHNGRELRASFVKSASYVNGVSSKKPNRN